MQIVLEKSANNDCLMIDTFKSDDCKAQKFVFMLKNEHFFHHDNVLPHKA